MIVNQEDFRRSILEGLRRCCFFTASQLKGWRLSVSVVASGCAILLGLPAGSPAGRVAIPNASNHTLDHAVSQTWDASRLTTLPDGVLHYTPNGNFDDT